MKTSRPFSYSARARRILAAAIAPAALALLATSVDAGNTWDGGSGDDNWGTAANWSPDGAPAYGTLTFAGATRTTNFNNSITAMNIVLWTGTSNWVMNGSSTLSLFDFGGGQAKLENQSTGSVTINAPIVFAANNGSPPNPFGEITALNGNLTFASSTLTVNGSSVNGIKFWGGAGKTVTFGSTVNASGKWFGITSSAGTSVTIATGANVTVGDIYVMNNGTLNLAGGTLTTSAVRLGGDFGNTGNQNLTQSGTLALTPAAGGITFSSTINAVTGNTSNALLVDSQNTSGTNTLTGGIFLDSDLKVQQASGGTLALTTGTLDVKARKLTFDGAGTVSVSRALASTLGAGGFIVKDGVGSLILTNIANTYTGTTNATLNANGTQIAGGTLGIHGDGSLGLAPSGAYNNIQFTGSGTLQDTANDISLHANRNISIAASATATFDNNGNVFTINGIINGATGNLATTGGGTVVLTAANTHGGTTAVNGGTLQLGDGGTSGSIANTSEITVGSGATLAINRSDTITIAQGIQGAGGVRKLGSGVAVFTGANSYSGGTQIDEGIVRVGAVDSLPLTGAIVIANAAGAALDLDGNNQTIGSLSGGGALGGNVTLGSGTLTVGDSSNTTYGGIISGTGGSLVKQGNGILTLTNSSTYTGSTTINAGTIRNGVNDALPTTTALTLADAASVLFDLDSFNQTVGSLAGGGTSGGMVALGSGTLTVGDTSSTTFNGTLTGAGGSLVKQGSGTLTLGSGNTYSGTTTVSAGTLSVGHASALGSTAAGTSVTGTGSLELQSGIVLDGEALTLNGDGGGFNGALRSAGSSTVQNAAITLGSASTIKSNTGTLSIAASSPISGTDVGLTVGGNGDMSIASNVNLGTGALTKNDLGTLTLGGANTFSSLVVNAGTVNASADANLGTAGGTVNFAGTGTLHATDTFATNRPLTLTSTSFLEIDSTKSVEWSGQVSGAGGLIKTGGGTLTLSGSNSYVSATQVNGGTLVFSASDNLGNGGVGNNLSLANGTLRSTGASVDLGTNRSVGVGAPSTIEVTGSNTLTVSGAISGSAGLTKADTGTLVLSANNSTFSGSLAITGGTIAAAASNNLGDASATNSLTLAGGTLHSTASFDLGSNRALSLGAGGGTFDVDASTTLTASGSITGSGALTKAGAGTLTLSGNSNDYSGATFINAGTLHVTNASGSATGTGAVSVANGGTLSGDGAISGAVTVLDGGAIRPGASIGTLETGALTLDDGALLQIEVETADQLADLLAISNAIPADGDLTLNGTITLDITDLDPGTLDLHDVIVFASYTGDLVGTGLFRVPGFDYDLPDYTGDDSVAHFFLSGNALAIDYDYEDTINFPGAKLVAFIAVPEPGALAALAGGAGILLGLCRLRRRSA